MSLPVALVTNDDGIESWFLTRLVEALRGSFDVRVVAPHHEQSWSGRSFSQNRRVRIHRHPDRDYPCWSVEGTPTDCTNIALGNLLSEPPDIVVSGINMGFNVSLPLVLTSGTVAAALEGALWGLPAVAGSLALPREWYGRVKQTAGKAGGAVETALGHACAHMARTATGVLAAPDTRTVVHSLNFPFSVTEQTPIERTHPARLALGALFEWVGDDEVQFCFPKKRPEIGPGAQTDYACLQREHISHTVIDYERLAPQPGA